MITMMNNKQISQHTAGCPILSGWGTDCSVSKKTRMIYAALTFFGIATATYAAGPRQIITKANTQYENGNFAEAAETYQSLDDAETADELRAIALHNKAAAHFKLNDFAAAKEAWVQTLNYNDATFEARVRYNLGNCNYQEALAALESQDPLAAANVIPALEKAIAQYRDAIRLDSQNTNARANLQLAYQLKKQIEDQQNEQQDSQDQQNNQQQQQSDENQQQNQDENQQQENNEQQQSDQQQEQNQQNQDKNEQNQQQSQQNEQQQSESEQQQQQDENEQQGRQKQDEQEESDEEQQQQSGSDECPLEQPEEGGDKESEEQKPSPQSDEQADGKQDRQQLPEIKLTEEQIKELLQHIRDREKQRRKELQARLRAQYREQPVKRDW